MLYLFQFEMLLIAAQVNRCSGTAYRAVTHKFRLGLKRVLITKDLPEMELIPGDLFRQTFSSMRIYYMGVHYGDSIGKGID